MKVFINKIIKLLRLQKIRNKYFVIMMGLSLPPLLLLGFISHNITKDTLIQNQLQSTKDHLETSSEVADLLFLNIINMQRLIAWDKELHRELKESAALLGEEEGTINRDTAKRMLNLLASYSIDTRDIDSICLFDNNFRSICYGNTSSTGKFGVGNIIKNTADQEWYHEVLDAQGKVVFYESNVLTNSTTTFSSAKLLKDPDELFIPNKTGVLVVNLKKSIFSKVFSENEMSKFLVLNSPTHGENLVYEYPASFIKQMESNKSLSDNLQDLADSGYLISKERNRTTGWTFVNIVEKKELLKQSEQIGWATTIISSLIAFCALYLSFILSGTISRPVLQLKKMTVGWAKEAWNLEVPVNKDEIETIGETFNRMAKERQEMNEQLLQSKLKEREAELRALQAQIKPHFLYNTLDSIYWMATIQNNTEIAKMSISLSESFKLSLNNGKDFILVAKELEHINHYLAIQNLRYRDRFQYFQDVEPELLNMEVLKLLLQPLIENAIYHGLEPKKGKGTIRLTGKISGNKVLFTVEDDGVGIENMEVTEQGFGLKNVRERIALYYGPTSRFNISSEVNKGTRIEIEFDRERGILNA